MEPVWFISSAVLVVEGAAMCQELAAGIPFGLLRSSELAEWNLKDCWYGGNRMVSYHKHGLFE